MCRHLGAKGTRAGDRTARGLAGWEKTDFVYMTKPNRKSFYVK
jgi:hypothetical protein